MLQASAYVLPLRAPFPHNPPFVTCHQIQPLFLLSFVTLPTLRIGFCLWT